MKPAGVCLAVSPSWSRSPLDRITLRPALSRGLPFAETKNFLDRVHDLSSSALQVVNDAGLQPSASANHARILWGLLGSVALYLVKNGANIIDATLESGKFNQIREKSRLVQLD